MDRPDAHATVERTVDSLNFLLFEFPLPAMFLSVLHEERKAISSYT